MSTDTTLDQLAAQIGLPAALVRDLFDQGLIGLNAAQHEGDLRELRRARRLRDDLELPHAAITIILRLRQRTVALQHEVTQLRCAARTTPPTPPRSAWSEAEWMILNDTALVAQGLAQKEAAVPALSQAPIFPPLQARNLNGRTLALPAAFAGARNVVIVAFRREHQQLVDTWFPALAPLLAADPDLRAYEMPVLASGYRLVRPFIDGGMAVAIPSPAVRERTLTVYTRVANVIAALQIRSPETITILLVDRSGQISWRSEGGYDPAKGAGLAQVLATQGA